MGWLLTGHVILALLTAVVVTWQQARVTDPVGATTLGLITFLVAVVGFWPIMLIVAIYRYRQEQKPFR